MSEYAIWRRSHQVGRQVKSHKYFYSGYALGYNHNIVVIRSKLRGSRRGFDSPYLHQKRIQCIFDGGNQAIDWVAEMKNATRQAIDVKEAKPLSANDSTFEMRLAA